MRTRRILAWSPARCLTAASIASRVEGSFIPQSMRSTSLSLTKRNTFTKPSATEMGRRSSNTSLVSSSSEDSTRVIAGSCNTRTEQRHHQSIINPAELHADGHSDMDVIDVTIDDPGYESDIRRLDLLDES